MNDLVFIILTRCMYDLRELFDFVHRYTRFDAFVWFCQRSQRFCECGWKIYFCL